MHTSLWYQNNYRIRKKVLAFTNQYWIEDGGGKVVGYTKQKMLRVKEDIRIFSDASMNGELFRIQQEQVLDMWGNFAIVDSPTNAVVGRIRRSAMSGIAADEYLLFDAAGQQIGRVFENAGRGLARKYIPGGDLVPEKVCVEFLGRPVGEIKQAFRLVGDEWSVDCSNIPPQFDRRTLLGAVILMGMIERDRK